LTDELSLFKVVVDVEGSVVEAPLDRGARSAARSEETPMSIRIVVTRAAVRAALVAAALAGLTVPIAYAHQGHNAGRPHKPTPDEIAAFERAKPAFQRHCFRCHTTAGKNARPKALAHIAMDSYPFGGHHADEAGAAVRKALGAGGGRATMPADDPGGVSGDDLTRILAWADAYDTAKSAAKE
jgi:mono/diheme cytochrome c family protein